MQIEALGQFFSHLEQQLAIDEVSREREVRRLFHGRGQCWPGLEQLTADWQGEQLIVSLFKAQDEAFVSELKQGLVTLAQSEIWQQLQAKGIGLQHRYQHGTSFEIVCGDIESHPVVVENGLKYQMDVGKNQNSGLFLDMRLGRQWVQQNAQDKNVLNLFAYTCGFSVAAIEGGARKVLNVDMSRSSLSRGRDNHRLNQHDVSKVAFLGHDIFRSWGKISKGGRYDMIIIDPPSFQKGSFALTKDYQKILRRLPDLLADKGQVLACVNSPAVSEDFLLQAMSEQAPQIEFLRRLDNPLEFSDLDPQASLKAMLFAIN